MKHSKIALMITATLLAAAAVFVSSNILEAQAARTEPTSYFTTTHSEEELELGVIAFTGVVEAAGADSYTISGLEFRVDTLTVISGEPAVGDSVQLKALVLPDSTYYALKIVKIDRELSMAKFEFEGVVDSMDTGLWLVAGQEVTVNADTMVDPEISAGSFVSVEGYLDAGLMVAEEIKLKGDPSEQEAVKVELYGVIESITDGVYVINGLTVNTDENTEIKGELAVDDLVKVEGWRNADGTYLAHEIKPALSPSGSPEDKYKGDDDHEEDEVKMIGTIESISDTLWVIAGTSFLVGDLTKIEGNPEIGDMVKIEAIIQSDGTYLAKEIELQDDESKSEDDSHDDLDDDHQDEDHDDDDDHDDGDHDDHDDDDDDDDHDHEYESKGDH